MTIALSQRSAAANAREHRALAAERQRWEQERAPAPAPVAWPPLAHFAVPSPDGLVCSYVVPDPCPPHVVDAYVAEFLGAYPAWQRRTLHLATDRSRWPYVDTATVGLGTATGPQAALAFACGGRNLAAHDALLCAVFAAVFRGAGNPAPVLKGLDEFPDATWVFNYRVPADEPLVVKENVARAFWERYRAARPRVISGRPQHGLRGYLLLQTEQPVDTGGDYAPVSLCVVLPRTNAADNHKEWQHLHTLCCAWRQGHPLDEPLVGFGHPEF
ncbi:hypothetical protein [Hymenobacter jeollabukensis]|uniref:Uncharacterized protein n=1 Tax=Hymenobacter jeollabukensis TaxID=2025313 RepID=A0A5R8WUW4_9BACT|nr:hypothetical protein [Hymenobacter jeollabukensis]TLM95568.1 hypothetical protein FDY95_07230 [Hymenobacter jeollabukensis]